MIRYYVNFGEKGQILLLPQRHAKTSKSKSKVTLHKNYSETNIKSKQKLKSLFK